MSVLRLELKDNLYPSNKKTEIYEQYPLKGMLRIQKNEQLY